MKFFFIFIFFYWILFYILWIKKDVFWVSVDSIRWERKGDIIDIAIRKYKILKVDHKNIKIKVRRIK